MMPGALVWMPTARITPHQGHVTRPTHLLPTLAPMVIALHDPGAPVTAQEVQDA